MKQVWFFRISLSKKGTATSNHRTLGWHFQNEKIYIASFQKLLIQIYHLCYMKVKLKQNILCTL